MPVAEASPKQKAGADSAAAEERVLATRQSGKWRDRGAVWGGPLDDFRSLWLNGWDYEWSGPLGRVFCAVSFVFLLPVALVSLLANPVVGLFLVLAAVGCLWVSLRQTDVRALSARQQILSELVGHASQLLRLPPSKRPEVWQECEANGEKLENRYMIRAGIGTRFGMRWDYHGATDSYSRTRYFCVLHMPVRVLGRYRVIDESSGSFYVVAKMKLRPVDYAWAVAPWGILALTILASMVAG